MTVRAPVYDQLSALAEPVRARLLRLLEHEELGVGELARAVQLPQSTVSRHLKVLRALGWLQERKSGATHHVQLVADDLSDAARTLWAIVRDEPGDITQTEEDRRRLAQVLAERQVDSRAWFGVVAGRWDDLRRELWGNTFTLHALTALLPRHWTVADLGCGTGAVTAAIAPMVDRVIGVDHSVQMLDAAQHRLVDLPSAELRQGELTDLPFADGELDAALCTLVLHHVEDPHAAFVEIGRALKVSGACVIVDMEAHDRVEYRQTMGHLHLGFEVDQLVAFASGSGLRVESHHPLPPDPDAAGPTLFLAVLRREG